MPYCPKCGAEVIEEMNFCSKCGATLGPLPPRVRREKEEKSEKREKREKSEKTEKHEKREYGYIGPLIGGIILVVVGIMVYLATISPIYARNWPPILLIAVGSIILILVIYAAMTATERSPRPPYSS